MAAVAGGRLIECPDCSARVSTRAFMCPRCGCNSKAIAEHAKELAERAKRREPDREVVADFGTRKCMALPVEMEDGRFVVMPLERVLEVETLEFRMASTNLTVNYGMPEAAVDMPLMRFPIQETNLVFASAGTNIVSEFSEAAVSPARAGGWRAIQPMALKSHGRILLKIRKGEAAELPGNAHPFYRKLADDWGKRGNAK